MTEKKVEGLPKSKGLFAVDVVQFEKIRGFGLGIVEAAVYLALLAGSDKSNILSTWGIKGIRTYTGFTRAETKAAIDNLSRCGLVEQLTVNNRHSRREPRYRLPTHESRHALRGKEKAVLEVIVAGCQPSCDSEIQAAHRAKDKGWIERRGSDWQIVEYSNEVAFIPNSFVIADDGNSPLSRLITYGELGPVMLAIELYQHQNLMENRGVPANMVRKYWANESTDFLGRHKLHHLELGRTYNNSETNKKSSFDGASSHPWRTLAFWDNLHVLEALNIVEWAAYSANGKPTAGDDYAFNHPQRPLGVLRGGKQVRSTPEAIPAFLSYVIQLLHNGEIGPDTPLQLDDLVLDWQVISPIIAIENATVSHVEAVGILRMVHRADTATNKVWYKELCEECENAVFFIEQAITSKFPQIVDITTVIRSSLNS